MSKNVEVTSPGIRKLLKKYDEKRAIAEYIWNGFDAGSKTIHLDYETTFDDAGAITTLSVKDEGRGISYSELNQKFKPFFQSEKALAITNPQNQSLYHGKNGAGRLTFFTFASSAVWNTTAIDQGEVLSYSIKISSDLLNNFDPGSPTKTPDKQTGTTVIFNNIYALSHEKFQSEVLPYLQVEFGWFLELNKERELELVINGIPLNYSVLIEESDTAQIVHEDSQTSFEVRYVRWSKKLNKEYSKNYYIKSDGLECWKENTTLNNKGDNFHHSVYIQSDYFDQFYWKGSQRKDEIEGQAELVHSPKDAAFKFLSDRVSAYLHAKRRPFLKKFTESLIQAYEKEEILPEFDESPMGRYQKNLLEETVKELYLIQPQVFTALNITQKKAFVELLNAMLELGADDKLLEIIAKIVDMTPEQRTEFAGVLEYASMASITKTISMIKDRFSTVEQLKELVFNPDLKANERDHLQKLVEKHFWLFGEQYNLVTAEEPKFEEALRRYTSLLRGDGVKRKIEHIDRNKEMDIFMCRKDVRNDEIENVVVELKHPDVHLGQKEVNQVTTYLNVILDQDEFNADNMSWTFFLIGNGYDTSKTIDRELENAAGHGEKHLIRKSVTENFKVYVKKWSEIFAEFECRHKFILEKLQFDKERMLKDANKETSADEIVADSMSNEATETASWETPRPSIGEDPELEDPVTA